MAGAVLLGYAIAIVNEVAPAPQVARDLACQWQEWRAEQPPGTQFTILIANLANDSDGRQTNHVFRTFLGQTGIDVRRTCRVVALDVTNRSLTDAEAKAAAEGRELLHDWNADLLIWGEAIEHNKQLQLWFLSHETNQNFPVREYSLTEKYTLPIDFNKDIADQLEAVAFSQLAVGAEPLEGGLKKLRRLLSETSDDSLRPRRTALLYSFGRQAAALGAKKLDREWLGEAIAAYHRVLQGWTRERVPLGWAVVQNSLADAFLAMGMVEGDQSWLEQGLEAYRESLTEWTKEQVLPRRVAIQSSIGATQELLGNIQLDQKRFEEAAASYRELLNMLTFDQAPFDWATAQIALGDVLARLGEYRVSPGPLQEALTAYQEALKVWTRDRWPSHWAEVQEKIGSAYATIGQLLGDPAFLHNALDSYQAAAKAFGRNRNPLGWARIQLGMAQVLFASADWNHGMVRLEEGLDAQSETAKKLDLDANILLSIGEAIERNFQAVDLANLTNNVGLLEQIEASISDSLDAEESMPWVQWARHLSLARVLMALGGLKGSGALLERAVMELRSAMENLTPERATGLWAVTQAALGGALVSTAEYQREPAKLPEAVAAYQKALGILTRERAPLLWSQLQIGWGNARTASGWLNRNPDTLREAVATFKALKPELLGQSRLDRAMPYDFGLGRALTRLGELERDATNLSEGIRSLEGALKTISRTYQPIYWAMIQISLSHAELALAKIEQGAVPLASLEERIDALRAARRAFRSSDAEYYVAQLEQYLAWAEALLSQRRGVSEAE